MKKTLGIITLGCSKNLVDSEKLAALISPKNYKISFVEEPQDIDILVINTCGFVLDAKQESIDTILRAVELKKNNRIEKLIVTGCLSTRYLYDLQKEIPEVEHWFTVHNFREIADLLNNSISQSQQHRTLSTPSHYAYLKIAEGCNRKCAFCAIPLIRGKYKSEPIKSLLAEAKELANKGVKELILVAQDLTYYGYDLQRKPLLSKLIRELSQINEIEWIRLQYTYPQFFTNELIDEIAFNPKVCKYIDIPIQHISDRMLTVMRRNHSRQTLVNLLTTLRKKIPQLHLRTTVLVGHPGETKKDFKELLDFIKDFEFEKLGAFIYSHEDNTYAAKKYNDSLSKKIKQQRLDEIMMAQQEISLRKNQSLLGSEQKVIIDRLENDYFVGRTQFDSPEVDNEVLIKANKPYRVGEFYYVPITGAFEFDLLSEH